MSSDLEHPKGQLHHVGLQNFLWLWTHFLASTLIWDPLCDLAPLYSLKNVKNTQGGVLLLEVTLLHVFFTFLKLYKWYQIAQSIIFMPIFFSILQQNTVQPWNKFWKWARNWLKIHLLIHLFTILDFYSLAGNTRKSWRFPVFSGGTWIKHYGTNGLVTINTSYFVCPAYICEDDCR